MLLHHITAIQQALHLLQADETLNPQQQVFVDHMHNTTEKLHTTIAPIPLDLTALYDILPTIPQSFEQSLTVLYGYAKMLMSQPQSFNGQQVNADQEALLTTIYDTSMALSQDITRYRREMFAYRLAQRQQTACMVDVRQFLEEALPVYRYHLRETAVRLTHQFVTVPLAYAHPYHLNALMKHILTCIAGELLEYGDIRLSLQSTSDSIIIAIFATGLTGSRDEYRTLFQKDGRQLYQQQLKQYGGYLEMATQPGQGATMYLHLAVYPATTSIID